MKKTARCVTLFCLALLLILPVITSCTSSHELLGRWETVIEDEELGKVVMVYHFTEKGEIFLEQKKGDTIPFSIPFGCYSVKGSELVIESDGAKDTFTFSVSSGVLTLSRQGQKDLVFTRV